MRKIEGTRNKKINQGEKMDRHMNECRVERMEDTEEKSQKDQVVTTSKPSEPLLTLLL